MMLPHPIDRTVTILAPRETVFRYLTDTLRWAAWWGAGSSIEAKPGGRVYIRYPDGTEAAGDVLEVDPPQRIVFTYGYASGKPIPVGASTVTIRLDADQSGTRLYLTHQLPDASLVEEHTQGWRYQLSLFSNLIADAVNARASETVDSWFDAWADADIERRRRTLDRVSAPDVRFRDRFGHTNGVTDLMPHITAAQRFMPGLRLHRHGEVRHCQGTVLAEWVARGPDGQDRARGVNVFVLGPDGRIGSVTGFWNP